MATQPDPVPVPRLWWSRHDAGRWRLVERYTDGTALFEPERELDDPRYGTGDGQRTFPMGQMIPVS
jgi:hypothetical protein